MRKLSSVVARAIAKHFSTEGDFLPARSVVRPRIFGNASSSGHYVFLVTSLSLEDGVLAYLMEFLLLLNMLTSLFFVLPLYVNY